MSEPDVRVRMDGQVAVAELASGPANTLDTALCLRITGVFGELAGGAARAVVLTGAGAMEILRFAVGTPRLSGLIMSGQTYEAAAAVGLGLVDEAAGAADVLPRAVEVAGRFAALHPPAAAQARRQIRGRVLERIAAQRAEDEVVRAIWRSPEALDAIGAYVAKVLRRPA